MSPLFCFILLSILSFASLASSLSCASYTYNQTYTNVTYNTDLSSSFTYGTPVTGLAHCESLCSYNLILGNCLAIGFENSTNTCYAFGKITGTPVSGGGMDIYTKGCGTPVNCVGSWSAWTTCSATCGGGTQSWTFTVTTPASNGGTACTAKNGQTGSQSCNTNACSVDCVGSWGSWSSCSATCGTGTETQTFTVTTPASNGGADCDYTDGDTDTQSCTTSVCPVDCVEGWGSWGGCMKGNATCGTGQGQRFRYYEITTPSAGSGTPCINGTDSVSCTMTPCSANCVGSWGSWSSCSATCGSGTQTQTFTITTPASGSGTACTAANGATQSQTCDTDGCPVDCVGSWGSWSSCSVTCGGGTQTQTFTVTTEAANGGTDCSDSDGDTNSQTCDSTTCPATCGFVKQYSNVTASSSLAASSTSLYVADVSSCNTLCSSNFFFPNCQAYGYVGTSFPPVCYLYSTITGTPTSGGGMDLYVRSCSG